MLGAAAGLAWMMAWWASQRDGTPALARRGLSLAARVLPLLALLFTAIAIAGPARAADTAEPIEWVPERYRTARR